MKLDLSKIDFEQYAVNVGGALAILVVGWMIAGWGGSLVAASYYA